MPKYQYKFSVITGVYNVEKYLPEMVESILRQSIGFKKNIELILVDDGSTDRSGNICDEYAKMFPQNIKVIHKSNGGVSSARNAGMKLATGKYLNFCDADDKFETDAFKRIWKFFERHSGQVDVACVPVHYFDGDKGQHYLNLKFKGGTRVIDLNAQPQMLLFQVNSAFFVSTATDGIWFDERLSVAEDAKFVSMVLLNKLKLGVVANTKYWYRKRRTKDSAIDLSNTCKTYFDDTPKYYLAQMKDIALAKLGYVPKFIWSGLLNDIKWRMGQPEDSMYYYGVDEKKHREYLRALSGIVKDCDAEVIAKHFRFSKQEKLFLINRVKGLPVRAEKLLDGAHPNIKLYYKKNLIYDVSANVMVGLHFFEVAGTAAKITLSVHFPIKAFGCEPCLLCNGKTILLKDIGKTDVYKKLGYNYYETKYYEAELDLTALPLLFCVCLKFGDSLVELKNYAYNRFFPLAALRKSYFIIDGLVLTHGKEGGFIIKKAGAFSRIKHEILYDLSIIKNKPIKSRRRFANLTIVLIRWFYYMFRLCFKKPRWLIFDRDYNAGDNGESFLRYLESVQPKDVVYHYCLSKKSPDYARIKGLTKRLVKMGGIRHYVEYLFAGTIISSQAQYSQTHTFGNHRLLNDILFFKKFIFLQHGVINNDISGYINKFKFNISGLVVSSEQEYKLVAEHGFFYKPEEIWLTGLPRFDRLEDGGENVIAIMPTWRKYLYRGTRPGSQENRLMENFEQSQYFSEFNSLINDAQLIKVLNRNGYKIKFVIHPMFYGTEDLYTKNDLVEVVRSSDYGRIFSTCKLLITDYSSVVYDFAYLYKPVIYFQFDKQEMFSGRHTYTLDNDYENEGFGEVVYARKDLIRIITAYIKQDCKLKAKYKSRIDGYFKYHDKHNSARVYERLTKNKKG